MNIEKERAEFESWCREKYDHHDMERCSDGYISTATHPFITMTYASVQMLWEVWQARAALSQQGYFDRKRFERAPCYLCGYNGEGYYQPDKHPCAARYHARHTADG